MRTGRAAVHAATSAIVSIGYSCRRVAAAASCSAERSNAPGSIFRPTT
jgi:hypothetical protein